MRIFSNLEQVICSAEGKKKKGKLFLKILSIIEQQFLPTLIILISQHLPRSDLGHHREILCPPRATSTVDQIRYTR